MQPSPIAEDLIAYLYKLCEILSLKKTDEKFTIEGL